MTPRQHGRALRRLAPLLVVALAACSPKRDARLPSATPPTSQSGTPLSDVRVGDDIHVWLRAGAPVCASSELGCRVELKVTTIDATGVRGDDGQQIDARFIEHVEREHSRYPAIMAVVGGFVVLLLLSAF